MSAQLQRRRFTADEYQRLGTSGILTEADRVELIDGEILRMSPIGTAHIGCVNRLNRLFTSRLGSSAIVSVQNPVRLDRYSEPQPDIVILKPSDDFYAAHRSHRRTFTC